MFLWAMLPQIKDATDIVQVFSYNLGLTKEEPKFGNSTTRRSWNTWRSCGERW